MTHIEQLLTKYEKSTSAERYTTEYKRKLKQETARKNRHLILDELLTEIPFHITTDQETQIRYWIDRFNNNFKDFHRQASNETIILAFIIIQLKQENKRLNIEKLSISRKYNLTQRIFNNIQNELIFQLMKTTELRYTQSKYYNHEILKKGEYE